MRRIARTYLGSKNKKTISITGLILVFGVMTSPAFPNLAQAADADIAANHADLSVDNLVLTSALEAQQDAALDQAFAELPAAAPEGTAPTVNAEAIVVQRLAAIQDSAQEAATLGYGAPVAGAGGLLGTPEEMGHAGTSHEEAGCLGIFQGSVGVGFDALTQGLPEGALSPETTARFEAMHGRFEQMAERFQGMIFGGPAEAGGNLPGGAPLPGAGGPIGGPEGFVMPAVGGFQFQDLGTMFGAAALGVNPTQFAQSMSQMIGARAEFLGGQLGEGPAQSATGEVNNPWKGPNWGGSGWGALGTGSGFGQLGGGGPTQSTTGAGDPGPFSREGVVRFFGGDPNAAQVWMPDGRGGFGLVQTNTLSRSFEGTFHFGNVALQDPAFNTAALAIADQIRQQITENIAQKIEAQILQNLSPEALKTKEALDADFTAADLTTVQNVGPITRAFSYDIADSYEGQSFPGQEHIHVTYTRDADGDLLHPLDHVDANVTAIHDADHTTSVVLDTEGADHIPGIVA